MSRPRFRAWRFRIPRLSGGDGLESFPASEAGLCVSASGSLEMVEDEESVRQAILLLLATRPGERVMRPDYGCELHRLMFSPNDDTTAGLATHYVQRALARWEPRIQVLHLDTSRVQEEPGRLDIQLEYRVRATQRSGRLNFPLELSGESI
ncbi:MAG TPA: GPW/gp25 family protein [Terriglobia bacterium]|nr:GPW/gp25 family protein [Terriglobia bacterium]